MAGLMWQSAVRLLFGLILAENQGVCWGLCDEGANVTSTALWGGIDAYWLSEDQCVGLCCALGSLIVCSCHCCCSCCCAAVVLL
jgi:hypothetical protein